MLLNDCPVQEKKSQLIEFTVVGGAMQYASSYNNCYIHGWKDSLNIEANVWQPEEVLLDM